MGFLKIVDSIHANPKRFSVELYRINYDDSELVLINTFKLRGMRFSGSVTSASSLTHIESASSLTHIEINDIMEHMDVHKNKSVDRKYKILVSAQFPLFTPDFVIEIDKYPMGKIVDTGLHFYRMIVSSEHSVKNNGFTYYITKNVLKTPNDFIIFLYNHIKLNHSELS